MLRPAGLSLLACLGLALAADTPGQASDALWINSEAARPWLPAIAAAAAETKLSPALIAELIGLESGFQNIQNAHSSAAGMGQQIRGNRVMWLYGLNRMKPEDSILGAALEFRQNLDRTGTIAGAARGYGTTVGLTPARQRRILARLTLAARSDAHQLSGQDVRLQPALALQPAQDRKRMDVAGDLDHLGAGRHQPR